MTEDWKERANVLLTDQAYIIRSGIFSPTEASKIGYKVVHRIGRRYYSWLTRPDVKGKLILDGHIRYLIGKWVKPVNGSGPLVLFSTLEDAKLYAGSYENDFIFKAEYVPSKEEGVWFYVRMLQTPLKSLICSEGAVLADAVKLLRKVA